MRNEYDNQFLSIFNEYYPFERYIVRNPKSIGNLFDDALLLEIFIPTTEIKPVISDSGNLLSFTSIEDDDIYIKIKGPGGEMRLGYFDFSDHIRENIRNIIIEDFGKYEWECLYVDHEDMEELNKLLLEQKSLIEKKYTLCFIKDTPSTEDLIS